jgi:hypothetical protein
MQLFWDTFAFHGGNFRIQQSKDSNNEQFKMTTFAAHQLSNNSLSAMSLCVTNLALLRFTIRPTWKLEGEAAST